MTLPSTTQSASFTYYGRSIELFKTDNGVFDQFGNKYEIRKHEWISDYSALYEVVHEDSLLFWYELPCAVQKLFK
jgi:hypothetical protein